MRKIKGHLELKLTDLSLDTELLRDKIDVKGYTLVPIKLYFSKNRAKILLGIGKGKKVYDKRETIKERDINREIKKNLKNKY